MLKLQADRRKLPFFSALKMLTGSHRAGWGKCSERWRELPECPGSTRYAAERERQSAVGGGQSAVRTGQLAERTCPHCPPPTAACRLLARRAPRSIVNIRFRRQQKKFVRRRTACRDAKKVGQHGRSDFVARQLALPNATFRTPTHRVSSPSRRGSCVGRLINARCPI